MAVGSASSLGGTSGTTSFAPSTGELVLYAFGRCGIRGPQLEAQHMRDARMAANMVLSNWSNDQPRLWTVDEYVIPLTYGQATYPIPGNIILILDAFIRLTPDAQSPTDLYMYPISRSEWSAFPDKTTPGRPTVYWFDRTLNATVTVWQPPENSTWQFHYYAVRQIQDAGLQNAQQPEIPYRFLKAFSDALSAELAVMYAPERAAALMQVADKSYRLAKDMDSERAPLYITPGLANYFG